MVGFLNAAAAHAANQPERRCRRGFVDVRSSREHRRLLFRYDPERELIEIVYRGELEVVDLTQYQERDI